MKLNKNSSILFMLVGFAAGVLFAILMTFMLYNIELLNFGRKFFGAIIWFFSYPLYLSIMKLMGTCTDIVICLFKIILAHIVPLIFYGLIGGLVGFIVYKIKNRSKKK